VKRVSTKALCYEHLAMLCDGYLKTKKQDKGQENYQEILQKYGFAISTLCNILKIGYYLNLDFYGVVAQYRPDLFEQDFYNDVRQYYILGRQEA
jgi:hypothetical protein